MPTFSVILPTYNRAPVVRRAIRSVLDQTWTDLELVVVDDCSTDDSVSLVGAIEDPRLRLVRLSSKGGPSAARNAGIAATTGEYIAFQDSDDAWTPGHLALAAEAYRLDPETDVTYGQMLVEGQQGDRATPQGKLGASPRDVLRGLCGGNWIALPAVTVRRTAIQESGMFDPDIRTLEDWDLLLRLASVGSTFTHIARVVVIVSPSADGVNQFSANTVAAAGAILSKHLDLGLEPAASRRLHGQAHYLKGLGYFGTADYGKGRSSLARGATSDPTRVKLWLALGLAVVARQRFLPLLRKSKLWWRST